MGGGGGGGTDKDTVIISIYNELFECYLKILPSILFLAWQFLVPVPAPV